jgi:hypothetical protein
MPFWVHDYYRPDATGGKIKKSACGESVGPPDKIEFVKNDVIVGIQASERENGVLVIITLEIPKGKEVRVANTVVTVSTPSNPVAFEGPLIPIVVHNHPSWNINQILIGETKEEKGWFGSLFHGEYFSMDAQVNLPKSETIKVRLPDLYINAQKVEIPEISFTKSKSMELLVPVNC